MNKGKSVCGRTSIRKELIEESVTKMVMEALPLSMPATSLEEMIRESLKVSNRKRLSEDSTGRRLQEIDRKMQSLLDAVERGIGMDTVLSRLNEMEAEKRNLERNRGEIAGAERPIDPREASGPAAKFFVGFKKRFCEAPIDERKALLRQVILGVQVHPVQRVA